ncbi:MAG: sigma-54-dependent Fis family transcriptional regulator [Gemmatimonadetes bacterium]|nr:sigma-54-dependent Fis family transcriptional regulator [Gemmatimonadota bacterium]
MGKDKRRVLVVDDENLIRVWLEAHVGDAGYDVSVAESAAAARAAFAAATPDAVLLDLKLPDGNGMDLLKEFLESDPDVTAIILSAHGDIGTAVEAVKLGAYHFLEKPPQLEELLNTLAKGLETRVLRRTVSGLRRQAGWEFGGVEVVGRSAAMQRVVDLVGKVAASDSTVLARGESGVGKEVVARAIHARSARAEFPFLEINCTALPETLLESELFGHEKGAFTDARERKQGLLELADRGTILLDEIGDLASGAQAKLLRFLETRTFKRVGGVRDIKVDVRIIASTNRDLEVAVRDGGFRRDLFYRLNVVPIVIPPLRDRPEDVEPLARFFLEKMTTTLRRPVRTLSKGALAMLERYGWPGNVRELRNVIERAVILEENAEILAEHLPEELQPGRGALDLEPGFKLPAGGIDLEALEKDLLRQAFEQARGNKTRAAELLGLTRDTLRYRLEKYGLASSPMDNE